MPPFYALVIGANSVIAQAIMTKLHEDPNCQGILAVSRKAAQQTHAKTQVFTCDYNEANIATVCKDLTAYTGKITKVFICNGILHHQNMMPEKKLEEVHASQLMEVLQTNTITPMLWLSKLLPILKGELATQVALFSARVGSISDNKTGGWYSYRASKAALNMLIQTSAVEYARRAKNVKLIAFHPGTTDTPLSKPFQRSVPEGKLFSADFVAAQLLTIMENVPMDNTAAYLDWNNQSIDW